MKGGPGRKRGTAHGEGYRESEKLTTKTKEVACDKATPSAEAAPSLRDHSWFNIPGCFDLRRKQGGTFEAKFSGGLAERFTLLHRNLTPAENLLARVLSRLPFLDDMRIFEAPSVFDPSSESPGLPSIQRRANMMREEICLPLLSGLGKKSLRVLCDRFSSDDARKAARREIQNRFCHALEAWETGTVALHGNSLAIKVDDGGENTKRLSLALVTLLTTKRIVEETLSLPSMGVVKRRVEHEHPDFDGADDDTWSAVWRTTGLGAVLPKSEPWTLPPKKREKRKKRTPKKKTSFRRSPFDST